MRSAKRGKRTSAVEVTNVSKHGFWLLTKGRELFTPFDEFPWFREASIGELLNVEAPRPGHLYWPVSTSTSRWSRSRSPRRSRS